MKFHSVCRKAMPKKVQCRPQRWRPSTKWETAEDSGDEERGAPEKKRRIQETKAIETKTPKRIHAQAFGPPGEEVIEKKKIRIQKSWNRKAGPGRPPREVKRIRIATAGAAEESVQEHRARHTCGKLTCPRCASPWGKGDTQHQIR